MRFVFFLLFAIVSVFAQEKVDFLFYLHDAGETNALLPVIESLEKKGFHVITVTAGVAKDLVRDRKNYELGGRCDREELLSESALSDLASAYDPDAVVTGVAFASQGQVLKLYQNKKTFAYWDNFNADGENPYFQTAKKVARKAKTLLLPTFEMKQDFLDMRTEVVGHPTLHLWREKIQLYDEKDEVLWIGSYGKDYEEAFELFLRCVEISGLKCVIQLHPKSDGTFEKKAMEARGLDLPVLSGASTIEAVGRSRLVLCHQSTVAFQALAAGKPVVHLIPKGQNFESAPIKKGLARLVRTPEEFASALQTQPTVLSSFDEIMGIPANSLESFINAISFDIGS